MKKILVVEDNSERIKWFEEFFKDHTIWIARTADEGITLLGRLNFDVLFLDHDLGYDPVTNQKTDNVYLESGKDTGFEVAQFIVKNKIELQVVVHSWNPEGAKHITIILPRAVWLLYGSPDFKFVAETIKSNQRI